MHPHTTWMHTCIVSTGPLEPYTYPPTRHVCVGKCTTYTHVHMHVCTLTLQVHVRTHIHISAHGPQHMRTMALRVHTKGTHMDVSPHMTQIHRAHTQAPLTMQSMRAGRQERVHTQACAPSQALAASPARPPVIAPSPGVWQIALAGRGRPPLINPSFPRAPRAGARNCGPAGPSPAQARNQKADFRAGHLFAGLRLFPPLCFISARR